MLIIEGCPGVEGWCLDLCFWDASVCHIGLDIEIEKGNVVQAYKELEAEELKAVEELKVAVWISVSAAVSVCLVRL